MTYEPICQFGPGGEYRYPWPEDAKAFEIKELLAGGDAVMLHAKANGLVPPMVSTGPEGIEWQAPTPQELHAAAVDALSAKYGLDADDVSGIEELAFLKAAEAAITGQSVVMDRRSAKVRDVAMTGDAAGRIVVGGGVVVQAAKGKMEIANEHEEHSDAQTAGDSTVHSGLSQQDGLFADDAGDWRLPETNKSYRLRARRRTGKKGFADTQRQAQRPLFADIA